jgi:hypothetical protein
VKINIYVFFSLRHSISQRLKCRRQQFFASLATSGIQERFLPVPGLRQTRVSQKNNTSKGKLNIFCWSQRFLRARTDIKLQPLHGMS